MKTKRRRTKTKQKIRALLEKHHLLSAPELVEMLPEKDPSTIYRNLKRFVEDGLAQEISLFDLGTTRYELTNHHHHHFVCKMCRCVENMSLDHKALGAFLPKGAQADEFSLSVSGLCEKCRMVQ